MIKKKVMTEFGVEADIWKVGYISLDRINKYGSITMCLYTNEDAAKHILTVVEPILSEKLFDLYFENGGDIIENSERFMLENCSTFTEEVQSVKAPQ